MLTAEPGGTVEGREEYFSAVIPVEKASARDPKVSVPLGRFLGDLDGLDAREIRPRATPGDHPVHLVGLPFEHGLHAPVAGVPNESPQTERSRPRRRLDPEEDALDHSRHEHVHPLARHARTITSIAARAFQARRGWRYTHKINQGVIMERRKSTRRWAIAVALLALLAVGGRCEGEVDIPEERLLGPHAIATSTR
jgi:hypothetical protein